MFASGKMGKEILRGNGAIAETNYNVIILGDSMTWNLQGKQKVAFQEYLPMTSFHAVPSMKRNSRCLVLHTRVNDLAKVMMKLQRRSLG